jgi:hypothetical protein
MIINLQALGCDSSDRGHTPLEKVLDMQDQRKQRPMAAIQPKAPAVGQAALPILTPLNPNTWNLDHTPKINSPGKDCDRRDRKG